MEEDLYYCQAYGRSMRSRIKERLCDNLSFRLSKEMRDFLESVADEHNVAVSEAARICIGSEMRKSGAIE